MLAEMRWCAGCQDERAFHSPPCEDGHGPDCPDRACVACGDAIVVVGPVQGPVEGLVQRGTTRAVIAA